MNDMKRVRFKPMDFSKKEIRETVEKGRMLALIAETSNVCNMNCPYCYRRDDARKGELNLKERLSLIESAAELGAKAYHIVGAGESLLDPLFPEQLKTARELGMEIMVATNGILLNSDKMLDLLEENEASVFLKLNSFRENVEYRLTGRKNYSNIRNRVLERLLDRKTFNREEVNESGAVTTRLAIDGMITNINIDEALDILDFCRENNISPFLTTFIPVGRTAEEIGLTPAEEDVKELFKKAKEQDLKAGIDDGSGNIYLGGQECNQRGLGPYVNIIGEVRHCVGEDKALGNIRESPLKSMWDVVRRKTRFHLACGRFHCPPREKFARKLRLKSGC